MEDGKMTHEQLKGLTMVVNNGPVPLRRRKSNSDKRAKYDSDIEMAMVRHLNHDSSVIGFKTKIECWIWYASYGAEPQIVQVYRDNCLKVVSIEHISALLTHELAESKCDWNFKRIESECRKAVTLWSRQAGTNCRTLKDWPKAIAFSDYSGLTFNRLWFTPENKEWKDVCQHAPFFLDLSMRMSNFNAFAAKVYSIYLGTGGRKQVLWIDGIPNSGKSFVLFLLNEIFGGVSGCFTLSPKALRSPHYGESLIGKSLVMVNEASSAFLRSDEFKALVGDSLADINPKGKKMYQGKFEFHMVFASNDAPEIPRDEAILTRLLRCHMHSAIPAAQRLTEQALFEKIKPQIPYFLGFGKYLYEQLSGAPIGSDAQSIEEMDEAIAEFQIEEQDLFDRCFVLDPTARITLREFLDRFNDRKRLGSKLSERQFRKFVKNNYPQIFFKKERDGLATPWFYKGIKCKG